MVGSGEKIVPLMFLCPGRNGRQKVKGQGNIGMRRLKSQEGEGTLECPVSLNDFQLDLMTLCLEALVIADGIGCSLRNLLQGQIDSGRLRTGKHPVFKGGRG